MPKLSTMVMIGAGMALFAAPALAQGRPLPPQPPPARSQQGEAGPATPPALPPSSTVTPRAGFDRYGYNEPMLYTAVPVTVASDGRVYANFGFGYQLVAQQCSPERFAPSYAATPASPAPYTQPQVTQPVPVQTNQPVPVQPGAAETTVNGAGACWFRTRQGRVVVRR